MATIAQWIDGARPRTLPAAVAPVAVGAGAAYAQSHLSVGLALLALVVALGMQIGSNYANDYSDGVRGTDAERVGPVRLVGQGLAAASTVKAAAYGSFFFAAVFGLALVALTETWLMLPVGAAALVAAWRYTGGDRPYGYRGLGEVSVFLFFGLVATLGTQYTQIHRITWAGLLGALGVGALACALLVTNNLRDIPTDAAAGKRTLAVRLGDTRARRLWLGLLAVAAAAVAVVGVWHPVALVGLAAFALAARPAAAIRAGATGPDLVPVLAATGRLQLAYGVLVALGLALTRHW